MYWCIGVQYSSQERAVLWGWDWQVGNYILYHLSCAGRNGDQEMFFPMLGIPYIIYDLLFYLLSIYWQCFQGCELLSFIYFFLIPR